MREKISVLICIKNNAYRESLAKCIRENSSFIDVEREVADEQGIIDFLDSKPVDFLLIRFNSFRGYSDPIVLIQLLVKCYPNTKIIVISFYQSEEYNKTLKEIGVYEIYNMENNVELLIKSIEDYRKFFNHHQYA